MREGWAERCDRDGTRDGGRDEEWDERWNGMRDCMGWDGLVWDEGWVISLLLGECAH